MFGAIPHIRPTKLVSDVLRVRTNEAVTSALTTGYST